jgi:hypothetical protein
MRGELKGTHTAIRGLGIFSRNRFVLEYGHGEARPNANR